MNGDSNPKGKDGPELSILSRLYKRLYAQSPLTKSIIHPFSGLRFENLKLYLNTLG